jgi:hypothetical protein
MKEGHLCCDPSVGEDVYGEIVLEFSIYVDEPINSPTRRLTMDHELMLSFTGIKVSISQLFNRNPQPFPDLLAIQKGINGGHVVVK